MAEEIGRRFGLSRLVRGIPLVWGLRTFCIEGEGVRACVRPRDFWRGSIHFTEGRLNTGPIESLETEASEWLDLEPIHFTEGRLNTG